MAASNVKTQDESVDVAQLLKVLSAVKKGDFSVRMPDGATGNGAGGRLADILNDIIELNENLANELERISAVVGKEGKITQRASLGSASGGWKASVEAVNNLIADLAQPTTEV